MSRFIVVKAGSTFPSLAAGWGDFEHWILSGMQLDGHQADVVNAESGEMLPHYRGLAGIVVTGSHAMVTERWPWSERLAEWLAGAVDRQVPIFGICFGHQLLAHALGGKVGDNPHGREFGTVEVRLTKDAQGDALFEGLPPAFDVQVAHSQSVLKLPEGARRLASSTLEPNQAFVVGDSTWGVQFHPEFDAGVVAAYINHFRETLLAEGTDPDDLIAGCSRTPHSARLLGRFAQIASGNG